MSELSIHIQSLETKTYFNALKEEEKSSLTEKDNYFSLSLNLGIMFCIQQLIDRSIILSKKSNNSPFQTPQTYTINELSLCF